MLSQIPPDLEDINPDLEESQINQETVRYLNHIETKLYQDIENRKRIDLGLLFIGCQFSACSLSWLLFELRVTLSIIQLASFCVTCLPGLIDVGDSFNFSINSESWELSLGNKPLVGVIKLAIGGVVSWNSTARITKEVTNTYAQINQTYQEIKSSEGLSFQLPSIGTALIAGIVGILLIGFIKSLSPGDKQD